MVLNTPDAEIASFAVPAGWREMSPDFVNATLGGRHFSGAGMVAIITCDEIAGKRWLHLSVSRRSRTPTYEDLAFARRSFFGTSAPCYQVFPREAEHVNLHEFCLHLWLPLDGDPFPDVLGERKATIG